MARDYASIRVKVWQDDDFRALPKDAQLLYFTLLTLPNLSYCGVIDWRPRKVIAFAQDWSWDDIDSAAKILRDRSYLIVDDETEEALLRSFIRNDGLMKQPRMAVSMARAYGAVGSRTIQGVIVHELKRLHDEAPELLGWHKPEAMALLSGRAINPASLGANVPLFGPNDSALLPSPTPYSSTHLHTPGSTPQDKPKAAGKPAARATRIPEDFEITDEMREWAKQEVPGMDIDFATKKFTFHFQGAAGQRATKKDWVATWKNWMLGDYSPKTGRASPTAGTTRHDDNAEAVHRMQLREQAMRNGIQPPLEIGMSR